MTNSPFALAPAGWYARAGDPPALLRWWDGQGWTREVRGPLPPNPLPIMAPGWAAAPWNQPKAPPKPPSRRKSLLVLAGLIVAGLAFGGFVYVVNYVNGNQNTADLKVGNCVTIAAPLLKSTDKDVSWTPGDCQTVAGGPVSYQVTQKLSGAASCGESQYIEMYLTKDGKKTSVTSTYCLMENLSGGECIYADAKNYEFDVPCTDTRATAKVTTRVEKGSGVTCGAREVPLVFNPPGRTYCLTKP
jgi:Protein of unknown function (DUF2510)